MAIPPHWAARATPLRRRDADTAELRAAFRQADADRQRLARHAHELTQVLERLMKSIVEINTQDFFKAAGDQVDKPAVQKAIEAASAQVVKLLEQSLAGRRSAFEKWRRQGEQLLAEVGRLLKQDVKVKVSVKHNEPFTVMPAPIPVRAARPEPMAPADGLSRPQQALLDALVWLEGMKVAPARRGQMALVARVSSASSGFEKNVSTLRTAGLIAYPGPNLVALTAEGRILARSPEQPPTTRELHEALYGRLSQPQAALLRVLIEAYPDALSREELGARAGPSPLSSGFEKNVSTLRSLGLVDYPDKGHVQALAVLFLEGR